MEKNDSNHWLLREYQFDIVSNLRNIPHAFVCVVQAEAGLRKPNCVPFEKNQPLVVSSTQVHHRRDIHLLGCRKSG